MIYKMEINLHGNKAIKPPKSRVEISKLMPQQDQRWSTSLKVKRVHNWEADLEVHNIKFTLSAVCGATRKFQFFR